MSPHRTMIGQLLIAAALLTGCAADQQDGALPSPVPVPATTFPSTTEPATPDTGTTTPQPTPTAYTLAAFEVVDGSHPHDVAPAADGGVWFTGQRAGFLGHFDPPTRAVTQIPLGRGSAPHGVIVGPDGAAWVTDSGLNAIVRVDPATNEVRRFELPPAERTPTSTFDANGVLWFTGQAGIYGRFDPPTEQMTVYNAPRGRGPYGIATTPGGEVYYASLAGNYVGRIDTESGEVTVFEPPTKRQGARRVWPDSLGRVWASEWNAGQLAVLDPASGNWREWRLPGANPRAYAVFVDDDDQVWVSDFGGNTLVRFDPTTETFTPYPLPGPASEVRQILGRPGEVWGAASALDQLVVVRNN